MKISIKHLNKRQAVPVPTVGAFTGVATAASAPAGNSLALDASATPGIAVSAPPLASGTPTITAASSASASSSPSSSDAVSASSASSKNQVAIGTVIAACVGAFVGALVIIFLVFQWYKKQTSKARGRSDRQASAAARGDPYTKMGDKEEEDQWEGKPKPVRKQSQQEIDEKNFPMFKKSPSMRTTRTAKALEEHGFDLPPLHFSPYETAMPEQTPFEPPTKPFAERQNSGISWDGETVGDNSVSLRSVRVESGTMSPNMYMAKMTPQAVTSPIHQWESAEVLTLDESAHSKENPFTDSNEERRASGPSNPFFNAKDVGRRRSRSNSRSHTRSASRASRASRATVQPQSSSPAAQYSELPTPVEPPMDIPAIKSHNYGESGASATSSQAFNTSERAMNSLIAALSLSKEEVEERLRVVSMQGSTLSQYSAMTGLSDVEDDIATVKEFPMPPDPETPRS